MYCSNCKIHLSDEVKFCPYCGMPTAPELDLPYENEASAPAADPQQPLDPILDMPQPTAPMYTPVPEAAPELPAVYGSPGYDPYGYPERPVIPQTVIDPIFTWGLLGTIFAFNITILGIIFSAIARKKSTECLNLYGYLPGKAKAGRILSTVGLIGGIVMTVFVALIIVLYAVIIFAAFSSGAFN